MRMNGLVGEKSVRGNVWAGKCPSGNCPFGEMSVRGNFWSGKRPSGNCPSGNCLSGKCPVGELSGRGNVRRVIVCRGNVRDS